MQQQHLGNCTLEGLVQVKQKVVQESTVVLALRNRGRFCPMLVWAMLSAIWMVKQNVLVNLRDVTAECNYQCLLGCGVAVILG